MLLDEANMKKGDKPDTVLKKRDRGDDQDEDPSAGPNQGKKTKKRRVDESESSKNKSTTKESSKGKSQAKTSKSGKSVTAKELVEDPFFEKATDDVVQTFDDEMDNVGQPAHTAADVPQADTDLKILKKDWFKDSPKPEVLNPNWNTVKTINDTPEQTWFNEMVQAEKPPLMFDELMSTPIDFLAFAINRLKLNNITRAELVGPVFNLLKGHKRSFNMSKPLPLQDKEGQLVIPVEFFFNNDLEYLKIGNKERTYSSSITRTPATRYTWEGIEYMIPTPWSPVVLAYDKDVALEISHWGPQRKLFYRAMINTVSKHKVFLTMRILSVVSVQVEKKYGYGYLKEIVLFNLDGDVIVDFVTALKMFTRGIVVKNTVKDVQLVREILCERLLNFKFGYNKGMPLREWTEKDNRCTGIMVNKIDDLLFKRRVLRSLEVLVGGKKIEMDKRLLQRTNQRDLPSDILLDSVEVLRSNAYAGNHVKEILLNLNLPDHRIEQYFQVQDYALWDVIENRNSFKPATQTTTNVDGSLTTLIPGPVTTEENVQKNNDVKARSMLLMALPNEHLMTFNQYKDAKTLYAAIQKGTPIVSLQTLHIKYYEETRECPRVIRWNKVISRKEKKIVKNIRGIHKVVKTLETSNIKIWKRTQLDPYYYEEILAIMLLS
ncbi:hypothetical protein Tco_0822025 [Tanacetum coccineum]|uniref:Uncharacterized protein n=1 Tax=Tanacetum coccineum TaxID=301880 RepID=A0ABQ5AI48_9ASTR